MVSKNGMNLNSSTFEQTDLHHIKGIKKNLIYFRLQIRQTWKTESKNDRNSENYIQTKCYSKSSHTAALRAPLAASRLNSSCFPLPRKYIYTCCSNTKQIHPKIISWKKNNLRFYEQYVQQTDKSVEERDLNNPDADHWFKAEKPKTNEVEYL